MFAHLQSKVPLAAYTTFQTGGAAEYFTTVRSTEALHAALAHASAASLPVTVLGGGSNVLVSDAGVAGCVIKNEITGWHVELLADGLVELTVGAGMVWDELVAQTVAEGWWGLENLSAIPGTVGATPIQNVGAYGVEVADRIVAVQAVQRTTRQARQFMRAACQFRYRDSFFKTAAGRDWVVTHVTFALTTTPQPQLHYRDLAERFSRHTPTQQEIRDAVVAIRARKFPDWQRVGTAGSFFKNPIIPTTQYQALCLQYPELPGFAVSAEHTKVSLGWILDHVCGLRGYYEGPVGCYEGQALVVVQIGGACTADVTQFAHTVAARVRAATGLDIEWEVTPIGRTGD